MKITTIQVTERTKKKLDSFGSKGESYDDILQKNIQHGCQNPVARVSNVFGQHSPNRRRNQRGEEKVAQVEIVEDLKSEVLSKFKGESVKVFKLMRSLGVNPRKGKLVGRVGGILVKEIKYKNFRFYFLVDGNKLRVLSEEELVDLLIRFVRMSDKKSQQKVIDEIMFVLRKVGARGL